MSLIQNIDARLRGLERRLMRGRAVCYAEYTTAAGQTFANGALDVVNFDTKVRDTHNMVTVGAAWALRVPFTGPYMLTALITWATSTDWAVGEAGSGILYVDGAANRRIGRIAGHDTSGGTALLDMNMAALAWWTAGQLIDVRAGQNTGGNLSLFNHAAFNWIAVTFLGG